MNDDLSLPEKRVLLVEILKEKNPDGNTVKLCDGGEEKNGKYKSN